MSESNELRTMRMMAWERAKGELRSMLVTYWNNYEQYILMDSAIEKFIKEVEDNGWEE
jgi:hypothetical protein